MQLDEFGKDYLLLGLRIGKIVEGYVDSYYGPPKLKETVNAESTQSPKNLLENCLRLQKRLDDQGFIQIRRKFIEKILQSMETTLRVRSGEQIPFLDQVERFFDISPKLVDDEYFHKMAQEGKEIFKGTKSLEEQLTDLRNQRIIPTEKILPYYNHAFELLQTRTMDIFPQLLPKEEEISIELVKNQPWSAYNWYLGNSKSRIDINTDLPIDCFSILRLAAHEGYPGHHTEHSIKEKLLYREQGRFEHSILLIQTPEATISEGLANAGINVLYPLEEQIEITLREYSPDPTKEDTIENLITKNKLGKDFGFKLLNNLAIRYNVDGWSEDQLVEYGASFGVSSKEYLSKRLGFIKNPFWATYIFNYSYGEDLIKKKYGMRPSAENFKTLLTQPILPSDLI